MLRNITIILTCIFLGLVLGIIVGIGIPLGLGLLTNDPTIGGAVVCLALLTVPIAAIIGVICGLITGLHYANKRRPDTKNAFHIRIPMPPSFQEHYFKYVICILTIAGAISLLPYLEPSPQSRAPEYYFIEPEVIKFFQAISDNNEKKVRNTIMTNKHYVNICNQKNINPLYWSYIKDRKDIFALLLEHGADPNIQVHIGDGTSVMNQVIDGNDEAYAELLKKYGFKLKKKNFFLENRLRDALLGHSKQKTPEVKRQENPQNENINLDKILDDKLNKKRR
jgi:hypothetical protein